MNQRHFKSKIPGQIWLLGLVSFFCDLSTEMISGLIPIYITTVLGASVSQLGLMEGFAEALSLMVKILSGTLSDAIRNRKWLTTIGYGLAAVSKPLFPLARTFSMIFTARMIDRFGKGIRGAPRDSLIAFHSPPGLRGTSFGLRQAMDNLGAILGPLIAVGLMMYLKFEVRTIMWISVIPVWLSVILLIFYVKEPATTPMPHEKKWIRSHVKLLPAKFWIMQGLIFLLMLAKFSEIFLVLKAKEIGWSIAMIPMVIVLMNVVFTVFVYPVGALSDRIGRYGLIYIGIFFLILADIVLAAGSSMSWFVVGVCFWGMHLGFTQGVFSAVIVDMAPEDLRGTCLGIFQFVSGGALLLSNAVAGECWELLGSQWTFILGGGVAALGLIAFLIFSPRPKHLISS